MPRIIAVAMLLAATVASPAKSIDPDAATHAANVTTSTVFTNLGDIQTSNVVTIWEMPKEIRINITTTGTLVLRLVVDGEE